MKNWLGDNSATSFLTASALTLAALFVSDRALAADLNKVETAEQAILGLTGKITAIRVAMPASDAIASVDAQPPVGDLDLKRIAEWALNYLIRTPRQHLGYEPVFQ